MSCRHKFYAQALLQQLDFIPEVLVLGTFNPSWPESNYASWFYGRTRNNYFWNILPRIYGEAPLGGAGIRHWQDFCRRHRIALSDFILNIGDADENNTFHRRILGSYDDSKLLNTFSGIEYNDISGFLSKYPTIRRVYITRSIATQPWRTIIEKLMVTNEKLMVQPLLTPSANARFSYGLARKKHITGAATLEDYIFECWREVWYKD